MLRRMSRFIILPSIALLLVTVPRAGFTATPATKSKPATHAKPAEKPAEKATDKTAAAKPAAEPVLENVVTVTPDELVAKPQEWVGKNVKFDANFFAFSSLALDYKPAYKSSKTHLSFLVLRPNSHVPLSELKLAMMVPKEKDPESTLLAGLKDGDQMEIVGKVFSAALDDPWVEVFKVKKLGSSAEEKDKTASAEEDKEKTDSSKTSEEKSESKSDESKSEGTKK